MKRLLFLLALGVISSCGTVKNIKVADVRSMYFEYNHGDDINFGTRFEARVMAVMHNGKEYDITSNRKLTIASEGMKRSGKQFIITRHPLSFDEQYVTVALVIDDSKESLGVRDTVKVNFRGDLNVLAGAADAEDSEDQRDKGTPLLFRDGNNGDDGINGRPGPSASNFTARIWKEGEFIYLVVDGEESNQHWRYKTKEDYGNIRFDISGGNGGDGGDGGDGGTGKDGKTKNGKMIAPGNGGNGGNGSFGGNGGNGGNIHVILHPNAEHIREQLNFYLSGGSGGEAGEPGEGGKPGDPLEGQMDGFSGHKGMSGARGSDGQNGNSVLEIVEFDFSQFH